MSKRGFEGRQHAKLYAKFRPTYPPEVAQKVVEYARSNKADGKLYHLVDVGCGNGQSTEQYESYFEKITAIDVSASQIEEANERSTSQNITYMVSSAEELPVEDGTVDVICSAQAIHWCDFPRFWADCRRALKADGSLVLYGYAMPHVVPECDVPSQLARDELKQKARDRILELHKCCKFHPRIKHPNTSYVEIFDLIPCTEKNRDDTLKIERRWTLERFGKYVTTWSGYQTYLRERDGSDKNPDILRVYLDELKKLYGMETAKDEEIPLIVTWHIFILFSKRPSP